MDELSKEYVLSFFERNLLLHGDRPEAVRWTCQGQRRHYEALLDIGDLQGKKILDFGCGKGDLYHFISQQGISADYSGYDINEKMISLAQRKFPQARFRVFDIDREMIDEDFDYILLCGVFNLKVAGLDEMIQRTLRLLFQHCRIGLAFNALSANDPKKDFELHYVSPEEIVRFAVGYLSPHVILRDDRIFHDFMLYVYRYQLF